MGERLLLSGLASHGETTLAFTGEAGDPDVERRISKQLSVTGESLSTGDLTGSCLVGALLRASALVKVTLCTLMVSLPGGGINAVEVHIRGMFATQVKAYDDNAVRMPLSLARKLLRVRGSHEWVVGLSATEHTDAAATYLRSQLLPDSLRGRFMVRPIGFIAR